MVPQVINFGFVYDLMAAFGTIVSVCVGGMVVFLVIKMGVRYVKGYLSGGDGPIAPVWDGSSPLGRDHAMTQDERDDLARQERQFRADRLNEGFTFHAWDDESMKSMSPDDTMGCGRYEVIQADDGLYTRDK